MALTREGERRSKPLNFQEGSNDDSHYISHTHFLASLDQSCSDRGRLLRGVFCARAGCLSLALQARITPCPVRGQDTPLPGVVSRKQDVLSFSARTHPHQPPAYAVGATKKYLLSRAFCRLPATKGHSWECPIRFFEHGLWPFSMHIEVNSMRSVMTLQGGLSRGKTGYFRELDTMVTRTK